MTNPSNTEGEKKTMNDATCKTCGGTPNHHVPSMFDPKGIGDPGHKMPTPTSQDNTDELKENVEKIFIGLEDNLNDPKSILGYGHAVEQVITLVLKARTEAAREAENKIKKLAKECVFPQTDYDCEVMNYTLFEQELKQLSLPLAPQKGTAE